MIKNHLTVAWRNLQRNKSQALINIGGLALGLAAFIFILQYINLERNVNQFHKNIEHTYRLINEDNKGVTWPEIEPGYALKAQERCPEIKAYCRFENGIAQGIVRNIEKNIAYREQKIGYAEGNFFDFFSFPLLAGDAPSLKNPDVMFISASGAKKYFGNENAMNKTLMLANQFGNKVFSIGGVFKDMGDDSDIKYDMVFSLNALDNPDVNNYMGWAALKNLESQYTNTYFLLDEHADYKQVEKKLIDLRNESDKDKDGLIFRLQPFDEVHMAKKSGDTYLHFAQRKYVFILGAIALLILLIAWFNYINFSTAQSLKRAGEVGVRKVIGASGGNLVAQFLWESILVNFIGFVLSVSLVSMLQPLFNNLIGKQLSWQSLFSDPTWLIGFGLIALGSLISGGYSAFVLANFNPVLTLKGKLLKGGRGSVLRKVLVVSQFTISIALIIGTIAVFYQLRYMQEKDLGFATDQLMVIQAPEIGVQDSTFINRQAGFWNEVGHQSFVKEYCTSGSIPGKGYNFATSGFTQPASKPGDELTLYSFAIINDQYLPTYKIPLVAGRNFTAKESDVEWNKNNKILVNETTVHKLGFNSAEEAINTRIKWDERYLEIIGVVKDYNHRSVQQSIDPIMFYPQARGAYFSIRLTPEKIRDKLVSLEKSFQSSFPGNPFEYFFVDENFNKAYQNEKQYGSLFMTASLWAIFIAMLGLFGLATFSIQSRTKEFGIRKVLGAGVGSILTIVTKEFIILIGIALVIASPIAYLGVNNWLKDFATRIELHWWIFAAAGLFVMTIALLTIATRALKAALSNPINALKTE